MQNLLRYHHLARRPKHSNAISRACLSTFTSAVTNNDTSTASSHDRGTYNLPSGSLYHSGTYELRPLSRETCTRVLTIHPSVDRIAPVSLHVEEIDLAGSYEPFVAISHVWGSNLNYSRLALCNGKPYRITDRVDSLLRRIRAKISENSNYEHWNRIWIDTICIDQSDNVLARKEKNHQVSLMHNIFGDAQEVVVDLGPADRYSHLLPTAKPDIVRLCEKAFDDEYCKDILGFPSSVKVDPEEAQRIRKSLEACSRLLDKQWMSRIWAVQEYALARRCTFLSGNVVIDGGLLSELGKLASDANVRGRSHLAMLFSRFRRSLALTKLPQLSRIRGNRQETIKKLALGESLGLGWHHDCTDERDTVYALRALVDYRGSPLKVDYNEPSSLLSRRVSRKLVELEDYEAVLAGARGLVPESTPEDEPSWSFLMRPSFKFIGEERHWILSGKPNRFRAGGPRVPDCPPLAFSPSTENCLRANASFIGTIIAVSEKFPRIPQYGSNPKLPVERLYTYNTERTIHTRGVIIDAWLRHSLPHLNKARISLKQLDRQSDELWRAITHGHNGMEFDTRHTNAQRRIDYWNMLVDMSMQGLEVLGYHRNPDTTLTSDIRALEQAMQKRHVLITQMVQKPQEWIEQIQREFILLGDPRKTGIARLLSKAKAISAQASVCTDESSSKQDHILRHLALLTSLVNSAFDIRKVRPVDQLKMLERRLAVLQDGRLISVPDTAGVGDSVVVFRGISVPYVLRGVDGESESKFKIAGMAYVDDVMHGEAVDETTEWKGIEIV